MRCIGGELKAEHAQKIGKDVFGGEGGDEGYLAIFNYDKSDKDCEHPTTAVFMKEFSCVSAKSSDAKSFEFAPLSTDPLSGYQHYFSEPGCTGQANKAPIYDDSHPLATPCSGPSPVRTFIFKAGGKRAPGPGQKPKDKKDSELLSVDEPQQDDSNVMRRDSDVLGEAQRQTDLLLLQHKLSGVQAPQSASGGGKGEKKEL